MPAAAGGVFHPKVVSDGHRRVGGSDPEKAGAAKPADDQIA